PVLEAVLSDQGGERSGLAEVMRGWLEEGASVDEAIARYHELRESAEATRYDFGEHQLNAVGYELLGQERFDEALKLFRLNVVEHETAWNPWDSLGEALVTAGRTEEAVEAYARSVELNPASRTGQAALRRLRRELAAGGAEGTR
ncbi:MAG TPA: hypothetical protein VKU85_18525, partial [bacterium]|nr:hypothetical protein [bacterium]